MIKVFRNSRENRILFATCIFVVVFRLIGSTVNVYYFAFTGAIFELLNLPTLVLLFGLPLYSFYVFRKDRFNLRSLALYSAMILILTIVLLLTLG